MAHAAHNTAALDSDGWTRVEVPVEEHHQLLPELLRLGSDAEVLAPEALRALMAQTVAGMAGHYFSPPAATEPGIERTADDHGAVYGNRRNTGGKVSCCPCVE
jgi:WYL domain